MEIFQFGAYVSGRLPLGVVGRFLCLWLMSTRFQTIDNLHQYVFRCIHVE